ncbi:hypothetical protein FNV43_RR17549 [Rhamnella rubrinervis]|uniref:Transcriptional coactivator p15 (PC4) C-terminal domain-containing protein n=1 Tax=Rhamnella rubrinervis TaxID=2594499 RepID=A0A8K0GVT2_9ROSA|nr:hypothetical protein FNV43_RR17549 [Rhamnella rubrinervis]
MSGREKRKDEECASDGDSEGRGPPKKTIKRSGDDDDDDTDELVVCDLSKNRKVKVRTFNGRIMVDIREYYVKDGKELPGKKGISLTMDQWNILRENIEEIDKAVNEN